MTDIKKKRKRRNAIVGTKIGNYVSNSITVGELRELLSHLDDTDIVLMATTAKDFWDTKVYHTIDVDAGMSMELAQYSEYHDVGRPVNLKKVTEEETLLGIKSGVYVPCAILNTIGRLAVTTEVKKEEE